MVVLVQGGSETVDVPREARGTTIRGGDELVYVVVRYTPDPE